VDRYVDEIAASFNVPRSVIHVVAAAKGLVAGAFSILRPGQPSIDGCCNKEVSVMNAIGPLILKVVGSAHISSIRGGNCRYLKT
jgi:hypothetical protein